MGAGCSFCDPVAGKSSYDFQEESMNETNGGNLAAREDKSTPSLEQKSAEGSENPSSANKGIVSQSQCEVNLNAGSSDVLDSDVENTRTGKYHDEESNLNSTPVSATRTPAEMEASQLFIKQEQVAEEDFKPGHVTRMENKGEKQTAKTSGNDQLLNVLNQASADEIQAVVDKCWKDIEDSCKSQEDKKSPQATDSTKRWKVVRLFVSSTFADYHAEREVLVKKVVPELREWCEGRSIHLIECDLRWGVPKDSTTEATIRTCLGEIDHCSEETDGEPYFLNMLGERYGWIPSSSEISSEIQEEYKWIFPTSITHMEINHAAYRMRNQNAAFLIRNADFLKDLPSEMTRAFVDDHPLNKAQLKALKDKLRQRFPDQVFEYSCQYDGIDESSGRPKVKLKGLENFSESVLEFFKSAISRSVPEVKQQFSAEEMELSMHNHFIELRGQLVLGRSVEISTVMEYVQHGTLSDGSSTEGLPPLMVLGSSGSGKSALMAHCTMEIKKLGLPMFYHFIGAGPGSMVPHKLVEKLVRWLKGFNAAGRADIDGSKSNVAMNACLAQASYPCGNFALTHLIVITDTTATKFLDGALPPRARIPNLHQAPVHLLENRDLLYVQPKDLAAVQDMSTDMLKQEIEKALVELAKREAEVFVIIIDAINQLADAEATNHMDWLPSVFPRNVRCVISAVTGRRSAILLSDKHRTPPAVPLHVGELNESARQEIVKRTLGKYNKKLDAEQMGLLVGSPGAFNPLWLSLACEELRVFGVFETITRHIKSLPAAIKELLQLIINRLTNEDEHNNVQKVLGLLACSDGGLSETELQYLLSDDLTEPIPMMLWAKVRRTLKPFLRNIGDRGEEERLQFFHASIQEVVMETILRYVEEERKIHLQLADYFVDHCKDEDRVIFMAPEQLKQADERKRLLEFLREDQRSKNRPGFWKINYYKDLRCNKLLHERTPFAHDIHICQFCSMRRGGFGEMAQMNKDSCFICGRFTPWKDDRRAAMVCHLHRPPFGPPNMKMCFLCRGPAFQNNAKVYLCPFCETVGIKKCAMIVGEWE